MKVDAVTNVVPVFSSETAVNENIPVTETAKRMPECDSKHTSCVRSKYSELAKKSKNELSVDESAWLDIITRANKAINGTSCSFEYSIHESTKKIMVKVIDRETKDIVREIPPEKILDMVARLWEIAGILVDERR